MTAAASNKLMVVVVVNLRMYSPYE
jgi:hypothetical protein